jgi:hypothetical protein
LEKRAAPNTRTWWTRIQLGYILLIKLDAAWAKQENFSQNTLKKMGGMAAGFEKPKAKKQKTGN